MLRYGPAAVRRIFDASSECGSRQYQRADKTPPSGCSKTRSMRPRSRRCGRRPLRTHEEVPVSPPRKVEGREIVFRLLDRDQGQRGKRDAIGMETDRGRVGGDPCFDVEGRRSHGQVEERALAVARSSRLRSRPASSGWKRSPRRWHPLVRSLSASAGPPGIGRQNPALGLVAGMRQQSDALCL
jgi:hypothetical protein